MDGVLLLSADEKGESGLPSEIALRAFTTVVSTRSRHLLLRLRGIRREVQGGPSGRVVGLG